MNYQNLKSIIEGLLFMAGEEGLNKRQLADILDVEQEFAIDLVEDLQRDLEREGRGIQISSLAGGFRMTTNKDHAVFFEKMAYTPTRSHLSQAALETLAIIAYRQPITRIDIEEIRGVKSDRPIYSLVSKDLIEEVGRAEAIGRPILYGTTKLFLDYFGLATLKDLPMPRGDIEQELEAETQMLFDRLDNSQLNIEQFKE
ncbi:SMC-Scp complex subunit ScpB [Paenibacillus yanchengensis]|uniref:Segregation and condensation protein B n=1 Tax=Paenibacillus yanchengensis TaxID=2035833 RepID=A0ABW4YK63_9BACL